MGANLGLPRAAIAEALARFARRFGPLEVAPLYRTEPVVSTPRLPPQPPYLNTVALGVTAEPPEALLDFALALEAALGRRRAEPGGPRTIDLDLLFVGDERLAGPRLELPHPRMRSRRFVLAPLADLDPELPLPPDGATPRQLLAALPERPWARRLAGIPA